MSPSEVCHNVVREKERGQVPQAATQGNEGTDMAKNANETATENETKAFVGGRRNRLLCLRTELRDFHDSILGSVGRTAETDEVLNAMSQLIEAIDYETDGRITAFRAA